MYCQRCTAGGILKYMHFYPVYVAYKGQPMFIVQHDLLALPSPTELEWCLMRTKTRVALGETGHLLLYERFFENASEPIIVSPH